MTISSSGKCIVSQTIHKLNIWTGRWKTIHPLSGGLRRGQSFRCCNTPRPSAWPPVSAVSLLIRGVQLKCDGTRWHTGGEVKGKLANGVGSQYSSHYLGIWCIQHYYRWCAHLGCQQSTELTSPRRFKWTRPFRRKTKSGFCACAITFQTQSTTLP